MTDEITRLENDLRKAEKQYARAYAALFDARLGLTRSSQTTSATAQQILRAGAKARGEVPLDPPRDPFAAAVIAAAKKARGEA